MILRETVKITMCSFRSIVVIAVLTLAFANPCCAQSTPVDPEEQATKTAIFTLGPTRIEHKKIPNMQGPMVDQDISLGKDPSSPVWIKSLQVETFGDHGPIGTGEFICHSSLIINNRKSDEKEPLSSIGGLGRAIVLPAGYAMRLDNLKSSAFLRVQILNMNAAPAFNAIYHMTVKYIEDEDARKLGLKNIRNVHLGISKKDVDAQNLKEISWSKSPDTKEDLAQCSDDDGHPMMFTIPPGRHTYTKALDRDHPLYKGGKILIYVRHAHLYGESVDLIDQTTGEVVGGAAPTVNMTAFGARADIVSKFANGVPVNPSHTYAIRTVYNNTTNAPVSGMALIHLYVADK
jgi:hypothetical protein